MDKIVILYTMKGCSYCHDLINMLDKENIEYFDRRPFLHFADL